MKTLIPGLQCHFMGWGANIRKDPTRPGTVWACSGYQVLRTDGKLQLFKGG